MLPFDFAAVPMPAGGSPLAGITLLPSRESAAELAWCADANAPLMALSSLKWASSRQLGAEMILLLIAVRGPRIGTLGWMSIRAVDPGVFPRYRERGCANPKNAANQRAFDEGPPWGRGHGKTKAGVQTDLEDEAALGLVTSDSSRCARPCALRGPGHLVLRTEA